DEGVAVELLGLVAQFRRQFRSVVWICPISRTSVPLRRHGHTSWILRLRGNPENPLANGRWGDSATPMIRPGFLDSESRRDLIDLAREGSAGHRLARRANA